MAFPDSVDGWIIGSGSSFQKVGSGPAGYHRIAYEFKSDNGRTLTYYIYHQVGLGLYSHIMIGYSANYRFNFNGGQTVMKIKNGNHRWNTGTNGQASYQPAKIHYNSNGTNIHTYTYDDRLGSNLNPVWTRAEVTFDKTQNGRIRTWLSYEVGDGDSIGLTYGVPEALKLSFGGSEGVEIDTGRPSYTKPTISIDSYTSIGLHDRYSIQAHFTGNNSGDSTYTEVTWRVHNTDYNALDYNGNRIGNGGGYLSDVSHSSRHSNYKPSEAGVGEGSSFTLKATRVHTGNRSLTASDSKTIRTYRYPKVKDVSVTSSTTFSGSGGVTLKYSTNGARWDGNYENFKTYIEMQSDNWNREEATDQGPGRQDANNYTAKSFSITRDYLERHISAATRNTSDYVTTNIRVTRRNTNAGVEQTSSNVAIRINYTPTKAPTNLTYRKNTSGGAVISEGSNIIVSRSSDYYVSNVYVSWSYPSAIDTGIVDGYVVRIYNKNGTVTKTYYVGGTDKTIPVGDLNPAQLNQISINAYYTRPNGTKAEGPTLKKNFVIPYQELDKPTITAPANNSNWINNKFRVLFILPADPDYSYLSSGYAYSDIQLKVNNKTYTWSSNKNIFSSSTLSYKRGMIVNP